MNLQSIIQPGYQDVGYQTVPESHRIPVAGTSDHGACADQKAGSAKHATFVKSEGIPDGYSDTDDVQSSHEYAYPNLINYYESYTCQRSEVECRRAQVGSDGYLVPDSLE